MKDEEFHDTTENVIEFGHEENVPKRKRKPSVKIEMPLTEQSILEGTYYFKKCIHERFFSSKKIFFKKQI